MSIQEIGPFKLRKPCDGLMRGYWYRRSLYLCPDGLAEWFEFDEGKPVYLVVHDRPAKNRIAVTDAAGPSHLVFECMDGTETDVWVSPEWVSNQPAPYPYYVEIQQEADDAS